MNQNFFDDKEFITESEMPGIKRIRLCSSMSWSIFFSFLLQIENHISDIDNWVKVSFSTYPWKNTLPFFVNL